MSAAPRSPSSLFVALPLLFAASCGFDWTVPEDEGARAASGAGGAGGAGSATSTTAETGTTVATTGSSSGSTTTGAATATAVGSSSTGGVLCDTLEDCDACATCAEDGPCKGPVDACFGSPECTAYDDCQWDCFDFECLDLCAATYPNGEALWYAAAYCVSCDACPGTCADACGSL